MAQEAVDALVKLLDLEQLEVNLFRGVSPDDARQRVFGGQVAGQALVAAARTIEAGMGDVHSLHAYFIRPGDPDVPIIYQVDRLRDGKSFTTRRVVAIQHGQAIFNLAASFQKPEPGLVHQIDPPDAPSPDSLPELEAHTDPHAADIGAWYSQPRAIDVRYIDYGPAERDEKLPPRQRVWLRADGQLPDDPVLHVCVLAYASDMTLLDTALLPHGLTFVSEKLMVASLDHAMWFHEPFRADEWLLYVQDTPSASGGRGIARGLIYTQEGKLVCSVMQEGLIRERRS